MQGSGIAVNAERWKEAAGSSELEKIDHSSRFYSIQNPNWASTSAFFHLHLHLNFELSSETETPPKIIKSGSA